MGEGPVFHSKDLKLTKASEKKEYFTNIKKESKLKKNLKKANFKKLDFKTLNYKKIGIIAGIIISVLLLIFLAIFLVKKFAPTSKSESDALTAIEYDTNYGIEIFDKLILYSNSKEEKVSLLTSKVNALFRLNPEKYKNIILSDSYKAEKLAESKSTAYMVAGFENYYGNEKEYKVWIGIAENRPFEEGASYDN